MFKHILVAVDGSEYSRRALRTAIELAAKFSSDVCVIHVDECDRGGTAAYALESPVEAARLVADAVKTVRGSGIEATGEVCDVATGHVAEAIVEAANDKHINLIVMGSRGLSDVRARLLGSVTHKVAQMAEVAVLVDRSVGRTALAAAKQ